MFGQYRVKVSSKKLSYDFEIKRKYTILRGFSASGKSELCRLISENGIIIECPVKISVLRSDIDYKALLSATSDTIYFVDESFDDIGTKEFAGIMESSNNYFVLITRRKLENVPYSIDEVYALESNTLSSNSNVVRNIFNNRYNIENKPDFVLKCNEL